MRFDQALRQQLVISRHHRAGANPLLLRALPHRRQARAGRQQAGLDALGKTRGKLAKFAQPPNNVELVLPTLVSPLSNTKREVEELVPLKMVI